MIVEEGDLDHVIDVREIENKIIHGHTLTVLKKLPSNSVDCVITSPPYWAKRDYGEETCRVWGGDPNCDHEWTEEIIVRKRGVAGVGNTGNHSKVIPGQGTYQSHGMICVKCGAWYGQLGLEPDPFMFVDHLIEIFREIRRVLKPHGNVFVVIDDTYSGSGKDHNHIDPKYSKARSRKLIPKTFEQVAPRKSLCLVPELFAIRMVYDLGFILRQKLVWAKKVLIYKDKKTIGNAMPESVKDRNTHTYEFVYHFVKDPGYYYDQIRLPYSEATIVRNRYSWSETGKWGDRSKHNPYSIKALRVQNDNRTTQLTLDGQIAQEKRYEGKFEEMGKESEEFGFPRASTQRKYEKTSDFTFADNLAKIREIMREQGLPECHPFGANAPDIVQINTEPFPKAHFAVYPTKLVELLIKVGCPEQVCRKCGKPRERVIEKNPIPTIPGKNVLNGKSGSDLDPNKSLHVSELSTEKTMIGCYTARWTDCGCGEGFESGIVLDPFLGSGTTALVALQMGRRFIGIELNKEYCKIALNRIKRYLTQKHLLTH